jgi:sirohydrochlorin ferrochelatase
VVAAGAGGTLVRVALVHGEPPAQRALAAALEQRGVTDVIAPAPGEKVTF